MPTRMMAARAVGINYWRDLPGKSWSRCRLAGWSRRLGIRGAPEENASRKRDKQEKDPPNCPIFSCHHGWMFTRPSFDQCLIMLFFHLTNHNALLMHQTSLTIDEFLESKVVMSISSHRNARL
jgi:hypothetical protein